MDASSLAVVIERGSVNTRKPPIVVPANKNLLSGLTSRVRVECLAATTKCLGLSKYGNDLINTVPLSVP